MGRLMTTLESEVVWVTGWILYKVAGCKDMGLSPEVTRSIDEDGWLPNYPAILKLRYGSPPIVDGRHRLSYLGRVGRLDENVPTIIEIRAWDYLFEADTNEERLRAIRFG